LYFLSFGNSYLPELPWDDDSVQQRITDILPLSAGLKPAYSTFKQLSHFPLTPTFLPHQNLNPSSASISSAIGLSVQRY
jgi:hypothetical protein